MQYDKPREGKEVTVMPRRVLHFIYSLRTGGAERSCVELCKNLPARYQPVVCATRGGPYVEELEQAGIEVLTFAPEEKHPRWPLVFPRFLGLLRRIKPDLVHTHLYHANVIGLTSAALCRIPGIGHMRGRSSCGLSSQERLVCRVLYPWLMRRSYRFIACSQDIASLFEEVTGETAPVIYNAVDTTPFTQSGAVNGQLRAELGIGDDALIVGSVARLTYQKNPQCLVRAASRVVAAHPEAHFVLVGDGALYDEVVELRSACRLESNLHLLGERHDVPEILPQFDIFALPTRWEGFSRAILEAMVCAKPVVTTDVMGAREPVVDGETGFLVKGDEDEALAERIAVLIQDTELRHRMGEAGRRRVEREFTLTTLINRVVAVYDEVLG